MPCGQRQGRSKVVEDVGDTVTARADGPQTDLAELEGRALEDAVEARGYRRFHARQIYRWIYRRGVSDVSAMTDLSRKLRQRLAQDFILTTPQIGLPQQSADRTQNI